MKSIFASKTFWLHTTAIATWVITYLVDHNLATDPKFMGALGSIQAVLGVVNRFFTKGEVTV
jgi:hypothetical protein